MTVDDVAESRLMTFAVIFQTNFSSLALCSQRETTLCRFPAWENKMTAMKLCKLSCEGLTSRDVTKKRRDLLEGPTDCGVGQACVKPAFASELCR